LLDDFAYFSDQTILTLPSWETLPGEKIPPSPDIVGKRFEILAKLLSEKNAHILLTSIQGALQKVCSKETLRGKLLNWNKGDEVYFEDLTTVLAKLGYRRETVAADKGEFAVRGGILDIFPISTFDAYRIDFFGDTIDQIRTYDPISQRSIEKKDSVFIAPAQEKQLIETDTKLKTLLDYLGSDTVVLFDDLLSIEDRYVSLKGLMKDEGHFFLPFSEFMQQIEALQKIFFTKDEVEKLIAKTDTPPPSEDPKGKKKSKESAGWMC